MVQNMKRAVKEVLGVQLKPRHVKKYFFNVYSYLLYQDTAGLLKTLEYRSTLDKIEKPREVYLVFRFMLHHLKEKHPSKLVSLFPNCSVEKGGSEYFQLT